MKSLKFAMALISSVVFTVACNNASSEKEKAYNEVVSATDSIDAINTGLLDSLQMAMAMAQDMFKPADSAASVDSSVLTAAKAYEAMLAQQKVALDSIEVQLSRFESFETEYATGSMEAEVAKSEIEKISEQQKAILAQQAQIKMELNKVNADLAKTKT